jgi:hypothetical protein
MSQRCSTPEADGLVSSTVSQVHAGCKHQSSSVAAGDQTAGAGAEHSRARPRGGLLFSRDESRGSSLKRPPPGGKRARLGRLLSRLGRSRTGGSFGDIAIVPIRLRSSESLLVVSPNSERRRAPLRTIALISRRRGIGRLQGRRRSRPGSASGDDPSSAIRAGFRSYASGAQGVLEPRAASRTVATFVLLAAAAWVGIVAAHIGHVIGG